MHAEGLLIPIVLFVSIATVLIVFRKFMNEERIAMIEKGVDAKLFSSKGMNTFSALKIGLLLIGAGTGLFLGAMLDNYRIIQEEAAYFSMLLIFGGIGLFVAHLIESKARKNEE